MSSDQIKTRLTELDNKELKQKSQNKKDRIQAKKDKAKEDRDFKIGERKALSNFRKVKAANRIRNVKISKSIRESNPNFVATPKKKKVNINIALLKQQRRKAKMLKMSKVT